MTDRSLKKLLKDFALLLERIYLIRCRVADDGDQYDVPATENCYHRLPSLQETGDVVHVQRVNPRHRVQRHARDPQQQLDRVHRIKHFGGVYEGAVQAPYLLQREVAVQSIRHYQLTLR